MTKQTPRLPRVYERRSRASPLPSSMKQRELFHRKESGDQSLSSLVDASSTGERPEKSTAIPITLKVYTRRSQSTLVHSTPISPPPRRSTRIKSKMMKRKAATPVTCLKHLIQTKLGRESVGNNRVFARRKLDFEPPKTTRRNDAPSSTLPPSVTPISTPRKAERTRRQKKIRIGSKVVQDEPAVKKQRKNASETSKRGKEMVHNQENTELAIVPLVNKVWVDVDHETLRVYGVLMQWEETWEETDTESFEDLDIGSGDDGWRETRQEYARLVDDFLLNVKVLLSPRQFSPCGGSVIDSVVGTFLTQNVADHLSSNAFMNLAAKYPGRESHSNVPLLTYEGKSILNEASDATHFDCSAIAESLSYDKEINSCDEVKGHDDKDYHIFMEKFITSMKESMKEKDPSMWNDEYLVNWMKDNPGSEKRSLHTLKLVIAALRVENTSHWDDLREKACIIKGYQSGTRISDLVDWEAVLNASPAEVARNIAVRGMQYMMACRIQAFLLRTKNDHGNFDLDWLRHVPPERAKAYLTSINGLGPKSTDCIRLLSLEHKAFPVDVNIRRICVRLGWVKLQGLTVPFHLIDQYPILSDVQKVLWTRLCTLSKKILYELHCRMITFAKVFCTKNPNCSDCPFRLKCKYYNSKNNSKSPPPTKKHNYEPGEDETGNTLSICSTSNSLQVCQLEMDLGRTTENQPTRICVPIIEEPPSPPYEHVEELDEQDQPLEDDLPDIEDCYGPQESEYDAEIDLRSTLNNGYWIGHHGKDMVVSNTGNTSGQHEEVKNVGHLRTQLDGYVLPDGHILLEEFEERHKEDPHRYLLVISSTDEHTDTVKGTVLIPFRTALRGKFPLKGTYFQDHEVFADYWSSRYPISIARVSLKGLERRVVYFGSSIHSITKDMEAHEIQKCFWNGYVCVRGFDPETRYPRRLWASLRATNRNRNVGKKSKKVAPAAAAETEEAGSSSVPVPDTVGSDGADTRELEEHQVPADAPLLVYSRRRTRSTRGEDHKAGPDNNIG